MANQFLNSIKRQLDVHGTNMTFVSIIEGEYDVETGTVTNNNDSVVVRMYKKHVKANQYSYPNLVGKDAALFYLANNSLSFIPRVRDKIIEGDRTYTVDSITEHRANGELVLYKILAVKG